MACLPFLPAFAQDAACTPDVKSDIGYSVATEPGSPYSATLKITFEHKLADGNTIRGIAHGFQARDSSGRVRLENSLGCSLDAQGQPFNHLYVRIVDPSQHTYLDWNLGAGNAGNGSATLRPAPGVKPVVPSRYEAGTLAPGAKSAPVTTKDGKVVQTEYLGSKFIDNVEVRGRRTTITIPAGSQGNDHPVVAVHEVWKSSQLGIVMADISDDPERGRTVMVLENFTRKEPARTLFAPPEGYTIRESQKP